MGQPLPLRWLARLLGPAIRGYVRFSPWRVGHRFLYYRVCAPDLIARGPERLARASFGARFRCRLDDMIQRYIYFFGVWEPDLSAYLSRSLVPGDGFIDVGANVGYFSLLAAARVGPGGRVVAIEASPRIFERLEQNLALNAAAHVRAVNVAASNAAGTAMVYAAPDSNQGATTLLRSRLEVREFTSECEVEVLPLVEILTADEIASARLIKIDVEGAELPVLDDLLRNLSAFREDLEIAVELSPSAARESGTSVADLLKRFEKAGFHAYRVRNDYSPLGYLDRHRVASPVRLEAPVEEQVDVIFSRRDLRSLEHDAT